MLGSPPGDFKSVLPSTNTDAKNAGAAGSLKRQVGTLNCSDRILSE